MKPEQQSMQARLNIDLEKCETLFCAHCGNKTFTDRITLKKVPALLSPTGREMILEMKEKICSLCGRKPILDKE